MADEQFPSKATSPQGSLHIAANDPLPGAANDKL
jgi:hypothetical protein